VGVLNRKELLAKLNFFYSLELQQVDLYTAQSKQMDDIYLSRALARIAVIEQQHVDNIAAEIRKRDAEPTRLGEVVAPVMGLAAGALTGVLGPKAVLKAGIILEGQAMKDYKDFIVRVGEPDLFDLLWSNLIDEDLHTAWFTNKLKDLEHCH